MKSSIYTAAVALAGILLGLDARTVNSEEKTGKWSPPSLESLPSTAALPELFRLANGERVTSREDWDRRRDELKAMMLYYQYGSVPPRPDLVTAEDVKRKPHRSGKGTEEWLTLRIGSTQGLTMRALLTIPEGDGPFPVVIREEGTLGRTREVPLFLEKGYMFVEYARHDLDPDRKDVVGPAQRAYPDHDWATLAVWAWGGMRVVDYLESRRDVDLKRIAITGHSRGGKMALLAGALDERFALVVPNGSGAGGAGSYRVLGPGAESLGMNDKPHWYHERVRWFGGREVRLPFDQHFLKALVAPRALLCTESLDDEFANPLGTQVSSLAAMEAYRFFDAPTRNGIHFRRGRHDSNTEDWLALLSFAEWHFFDRAPREPGRFFQTPFPVPEGLPGGSANSPDASDTASKGPKVDTRPPVTAVPFIEFVSVGNPGNRADRNYYGAGAYGAVPHEYEIGELQVTNEQYATFLNAVAASDDPGGLYKKALMGQRAEGGIVRVGREGEYRYLVERIQAGKPVNFVSWYDALRFCNWLHNGMPAGRQDAATTEAGAYTFRGRHEVGARNPGAGFFLPGEDEWYKAAYYVPGDDGGSYRLFSTERGDLSVIRLAPDWKSPCGAAEMADGVWEWNEAAVCAPSVTA